MKNIFISMPVWILVAGLAACNSNNKSTNDYADSSHASNMTMNGDTAHSSHKESEMSGVGVAGSMDKMMTDMHQVKMSGNVDQDFALMMKAHHQGAVDMSEAEIESGKVSILKDMALKISEKQKKEIQELQSFISANTSPAKNYDPAKKEEGFAEVMANNMVMMMGLPKMEGEQSVDQHYAAMMIPHHQSAVEMAEGYMRFGKSAMLLAMAKKMIPEQKKEIAFFEQWKKNQ